MIKLVNLISEFAKNKILVPRRTGSEREEKGKRIFYKQVRLAGLDDLAIAMENDLHLNSTKDVTFRTKTREVEDGPYPQLEYFITCDVSPNFSEYIKIDNFNVRLYVENDRISGFVQMDHDKNSNEGDPDGMTGYTGDILEQLIQIDGFELSTVDLAESGMQGDGFNAFDIDYKKT